MTQAEPGREKRPLRVLITVNAFNTPLFGWYLRKTRQIPVPGEQGSVFLHAPNNVSTTVMNSHFCPLLRPRHLNSKTRTKTRGHYCLCRLRLI